MYHHSKGCYSNLYIIVTGLVVQITFFFVFCCLRQYIFVVLSSFQFDSQS